MITNVRRLAGTERAPGSALIAWAAWLLAALGAGLFVVSFAAQYTYILAAKHQSVPSIIEALMLDVLLIVFSLLALGLSRAGKSSRTERVLIMACAAASAYMNVSAADVSSPRSVVAFAAPPVCLAIVVDRVVAVVRRHVLADDEASAWTALGRAVVTAARLAGTIALYSLRLVLAPPSTASGLRRWVLVLAPLPAVERPAVPAAEVPAIEGSPSPEPPELEGMTKKAKLTYWYERDPAYGDRGQASKAAKRIAPVIGLSEGTARAYVAEILRTLHGAGEAS